MKKGIWLIIIAVFLACKQESPKIYSLQDDVAILASDSLMGRETGTANELMAADYLVKRFRGIGLSPAGNAGTYYQT